jgi:glycosyltransferase involved in cell wall biosynthesis
VEFFVVGRSPPAYDQSNVFTPGFVEDLGSFLQYADVALCPLTMGSGTKLKMLDYLAAGLPIVTTPTGTQGLELDNGVHVLQVDRPEAFPEAIRTVLESEEQRKNLEENALDIADQYSWETLLAGYEEIVWNLTDESTVTPEA